MLNFSNMGTTSLLFMKQASAICLPAEAWKVSVRASLAQPRAETQRISCIVSVAICRLL
jgi:hypothetical protein